MGPGSALAARSLVRDDNVLLFAGGTGGKGDSLVLRFKPCPSCF